MKKIYNYYELVNNGHHSEIRDLYGDGLNSFVADIFVKCNMNVVSSDKYNTEGNNYFLFSIRVDSNGEEVIPWVHLLSQHSIHMIGGGITCSYCGAIAK